MECHAFIVFEPMFMLKIQIYQSKLPFAKAFALANEMENFGKHGSEVLKLKYNAGQALELLAEKHGGGGGVPHMCLLKSQTILLWGNARYSLSAGPCALQLCSKILYMTIYPLHGLIQQSFQFPYD